MHSLKGILILLLSRNLEDLPKPSGGKIDWSFFFFNMLAAWHSNQPIPLLVHLSALTASQKSKSHRNESRSIGKDEKGEATQGNKVSSTKKKKSQIWKITNQDILYITLYYV